MRDSKDTTGTSGPISRRSMLGLGLAALLLPGCGPNHTASTPCPVVETAAVSPPAAAKAVQVTPTIKLYGTLSPEQLERCYATPAITNVGVSRPVASSVPVPDVIEATVAPADPRWNVKLDRVWSHIVIHHSATDTGSAESFNRAHIARGWEGLGYHFVIGNGSGSGDGQVEIGYRWSKQQRGAHAGNLEYNEHGIGICLVGDFETGYPTQRQMASLRALVRFLQSKCGIATGEIIGHDDVPGKKTCCPGSHFPISTFRHSLSSTAVSSVPAPAVVPVRTASRVKPNGMGL